MKGLIKGIGLGLFCVSSHGYAHTGAHMQASFSGGFFHTLTGWDHVVAFALIGLFVSVFTLRKASQLLSLIAMAMTAGYLVGLEWSAPTSVEIVVISSLFGFPIALWMLKQGGLKSVVAMGGIVAFSLVHGLVQGGESQGSAFLFGIGIVLASAMIMVLSCVIGRVVMRLRLTQASV